MRFAAHLAKTVNPVCGKAMLKSVICSSLLISAPVNHVILGNINIVHCLRRDSITTITERAFWLETQMAHGRCRLQRLVMGKQIALPCVSDN